MDAKFRSLPPSKRFTLLQQRQKKQLEENKENNEAISLPLPAKKRKESRDPLLPLQPTSIKVSYPTLSATTTYCLPAKKRVWAPPPVLVPDLVPSKPLSPFDLNVEYKPGFNEEMNINEEKKKTHVGVSVFKEEQDVGKRVQTCFNETELVEGEEENVNEEDGILCAVCQSTDGDPMDPIVFCDGCDLMVHVTCYGNPLIKGVPEGEWYCNRCEFYKKGGGSKKASSCCLCPGEGGALKATANNEGSWAHLVCALLVPEVYFEDPDGREGIDCSKVPKRRWESKCYICKKKKGCVIECSEEKCPLAFHVTCGLSEDLCIEYKEGSRKKETIVAGFCKCHTELWNKQQQTGKFKIVARQ